MGLSESRIPNCIGTLIFDNNNNIIDATGIGETKLKEISELSIAQLDSNGFGLLREENENLIIQLWREDDKKLPFSLKNQHLVWIRKILHILILIYVLKINHIRIWKL
ncbi:Ego2p NDAI_0I00320 [Naumovozyma dairenensis CBS 421]|uniref:Uncharacterized protein n=1 Tax=Naumovozyma dairenensis (strain ATCC 10597 / BCRC 20456 / CBS 421 / NBRC 0211 / NRRL Y-12639) TaxID=1071378 RepID=G0WFP0_NAUDC|nr:hypothetical protein NDAI_0I00320 [Naumovozyma dairenensis CBS 421]CCD26601.1 hypothetical protein NDAI_0I00320 [Naumovozyma dairenensis CBS 421]